MLRSPVEQQIYPKMENACDTFKKEGGKLMALTSGKFTFHKLSDDFSSLWKKTLRLSLRR